MPQRPLAILFVDDEPTITLSVGDAFRHAGHIVDTSSDGRDALSRVRANHYDLVITDIRLPGIDGLSLFRTLRDERPETDVILITAYGTVEDAVTALKEGACDYVTKPFDVSELLLRARRIADRRALQGDLAAARAELHEASGTSDILGQSPSMVALRRQIEVVAASDASVLMVGESGTGKELVARSIHRRSARRDAPFIAVNCAAFPETLIEAELFGHERGAFTGALQRRDGRFQAADGGTLFLDEVAEIPLTAQAKLLRVLQERTFEPLGTNRPVRVDVRIISATHRDIRAMVDGREFRDDLYYRLKVLELDLPPLRERRGDLPLLVTHFLSRHANGTTPTLAPEAWAALSQYAFPGNVRELDHALEHAFVLARGKQIGVRDLPAEIRGATPSDAPASPSDDGAIAPLAAAMEGFEREYLLRALRASGGHRAEAARLLGISRKGLWAKLRRYALSDDDVDGKA